MTRVRVFALALTWPLLFWSCAGTAPRGNSVVLVTEEEAALPDAPPEVERQPCSSPYIDIRSPRNNDAYRAPLPIEVLFTPSAGQRIEVSKTRVRLLKGFVPIDLTDRVKEFLTADGVSMPRAELPRGTHRVKITVEDTSGASCSKTVEFTVH